MPVTTILLLRHGHRLGWTLDHRTGTYTPNSALQFPTGIANDPVLASHGVAQAEETSTYLVPLLAPLVPNNTFYIYSSLYYRCLETLKPTVEDLQREGWKGKVRGERGVGEWFGEAWFKHPPPAQPEALKPFFPWLADDYRSRVLPPENGESIEALHDRIALALERIVNDVDAELRSLGKEDEKVTILICGHAAPIICSGRVLTGKKPADWGEEDFRCFTCGISRFVRRDANPIHADTVSETEPGEWTTHGGVAGGWNCLENSSCQHLKDGEERGWHFNGDESFNVHVGLQQKL